METWIDWFLSIDGHHFMVEVDAAFIEDSFNLYGLKDIFQDRFRHCIDLILSAAPHTLGAGLNHPLYKHAKSLYGLIHARFILTSKGLTLMLEEFERGSFGCCPRYYCKGAGVLPLGLSNSPGEGRVVVFCPLCQDIFELPRSHASTDLDGAFFGPTFAHVLVQLRPEIICRSHEKSESPAFYVPKIFGFAVKNQPGRRDCIGADAPVSTGQALPTSVIDDALALRIRRSVPMTSFYEGFRPEADDFFSSDDDEGDKPGPAPLPPKPLPPKKRLRDDHH